MIVEYIRYVLTQHRPEEFVAAYEKAVSSLDDAPQCLRYDLAQCDDDPNAFILRIEWTGAQEHMRGFREGPHFGPFLSAIRPFVGEIAEMRHYSPTRVQSG